MSRTEDRLIDAVTALAQTVQERDVPPLQLLASPGRGRARLLIPLAAATAVLIVIGLVTGLLQQASPAEPRQAGSGQLPAERPRPGAWTFSAVLPAGQQVTATVATGRASAWAFARSLGSPADQRTVAWRLSGGSWRRVPGPALQQGETVSGGSASGPANVWVFTSQDRVLRWDGQSWRVRQLPQHTHVDSLTALGSKDVWVFGVVGSGQLTTSWHWGGRRWTAVSSGAGLAQASAVSPADIWAVAGAGPDIARWNGSRWIRTSLAGLMPPAGARGCTSVTDGIEAHSDADVWVVTDHRCQAGSDQIGLLHETGGHWHRVVTISAWGVLKLLPDGQGGVVVFLSWGPQVSQWFPADGAVRCSAAGTLTTPVIPAPLPGMTMKTGSSAGGSALAGVSFLRGTQRHPRPASAVLRFGG